jgi:FKBP-type peptidyl-prolyl cis-trans isomerase FklB
MKKIFFGISVMVIAAVNVNAQTAPKKVVSVKPTVQVLKNANDSFSYALGMNIAHNLKQQEIEQINGAVMQKGLQDGLKGNTTLLTEEQANNSIQAKLKEAMTKKLAIEKSKGKAFLDSVGKRPGVTTLPDGLEYEVLKKSDSVSSSPTVKDTVVANYIGTLTDGKEFDNSYKRGQPLSIPVGGVIKGWTEILQLMHIGDKWKVYIPSELAYGDRGAGGSIPGGATLVFELELLGIKAGK